MKTALQVLEEQYVDEAAMRMATEIDREILWGMLITMGWHRVLLPRFIDNKHAVDISIWLEENVKNPYERKGADFLFSDSKDATLFILRWR